jgi:serine-threonine kinase receptor-associated protein
MTITALFYPLQLWDALNGTEVHSFQHNHIVKSVGFNPKGNLLVTGSNEKIIRIFDLQRPDAGREAQLLSKSI